MIPLATGGGVYINVDLDDKKAQARLAKLTKDIQKLERDLNSKQEGQDTLDAQLDAAAAKANEAKKRVEELRAELDKAKQATSVQGAMDTDPAAYIEAVSRQKELTAELKEAERSYTAADKAAERVSAAALKGQSSISKTADELSRAKAEAGALEQQLTKTSAGAEGVLVNIGAGAERVLDSIGKRVKSAMKRFLSVYIIMAAVRSVRSYFTSVIGASSEMSAELARLKGALLTFAQPIMNVVIPALRVLVQVLTAVVTQIASVFAVLAGTSLSGLASQAKELDKNIKGVGSSAKKSARSLASFDEINVLSSNDSGGGASATQPDFSFVDGVSEKLQEIAKWVLLIGAGFALWKIGQALPGTIGLLLSKLGLLAIAIGGIALLWIGLKDAWENGADWGNAALMVGGLTVAALALYKAFGKTAAGIALIVGGVALVATAFKDAMENGWNLQNMFLAIAGTLATGLGISLLTGSLIPLLIAGIAALLLAITVLTGNGEQLLGNLKQAFGGLKDFIVGVFTGDTEKALEGLKNFAKGIFNAILTVFGSLVNLIIRGLNWLIGKINSIKFDVPEWVPLIGGKSLSPHIPTITAWKIPQLAEGAVIPPNKSFMAVLGDQKSGTNIEAPLDTIKQALAEVMGQYGGGVSVEVYLDSERVTNKIVKKINSKSRSSGQSVLV